LSGFECYGLVSSTEISVVDYPVARRDIFFPLFNAAN